jgi:Tfp pilus assembly protein PilN
MSARIPLPLVNFSRDLRKVSLAVAVAAGVLALGALLATAILVFDGASLRTAQERMVEQAAALAAETATLRKEQTLNEPEAAAIGLLRQRIASLNALDFEQAPAVTRVLSVLEELMPPTVALQNFDYDRAKGSLELQAVSGSSEDLTAFFDVASRSPFFKTVRLVDKKQAGTSDDGTALFQVRLSVALSSGEPRA